MCNYVTMLYSKKKKMYWGNNNGLQLKKNKKNATKVVINLKQNILWKPHGDHKAKSYSRYTKDKQKGIQYTYRKSSKHK